MAILMLTLGVGLYEGIHSIETAMTQMWLPLPFVSTIGSWAWGLLFGLGVIGGAFFFSVIQLFVLGFFSGNIIQTIARRYHIRLAHMHIPRVVWLMAISVVVHLLLLIPMLLLFWLPLIGQGLSILWSISLFRSLLVIDCGSAIFAHNEFQQHKYGYWFIAGCGWLLTLIPVVNLVAPIIAVVWCAHVMLENRNKHRPQLG